MSHRDEELFLAHEEFVNLKFFQICFVSVDQVLVGLRGKVVVIVRIRFVNQVAFRNGHCIQLEGLLLHVLQHLNGFVFSLNFDFITDYLFVFLQTVSCRLPDFELRQPHSLDGLEAIKLNFIEFGLNFSVHVSSGDSFSFHFLNATFGGFPHLVRNHHKQGSFSCKRRDYNNLFEVCRRTEPHVVSFDPQEERELVVNFQTSLVNAPKPSVVVHL